MFYLSWKGVETLLEKKNKRNLKNNNKIVYDIKDWWTWVKNNNYHYYIKENVN